MLNWISWMETAFLNGESIEDGFTRLWKAGVALGVFNLKPSCVCM